MPAPVPPPHPQVGTLSLPLRGLLRQGQPASEILLRVPVADPGLALRRLEPGGGDARLCCSPLRGSFVVRLACSGSRAALACLHGLQGGSHSWPASPLKQQRQQGAGEAAAVVRARPALEEGGALARELARQEGVSGGRGVPRIWVSMSSVGGHASRSDEAVTADGYDD